MILYNASTSYGIRNFARFHTNTNSTTFSDADVDASINTYYYQFVNEILESMDDWDFQGENATADLVEDQQEYTFPTDILKIKRIEVTYDGTNWYLANWFDINERGQATDSTSISQDFEKTKPFVDLYDNSLFLYPIPDDDVTGGLRIWYEEEPTLLSSVTDEPIIAQAYQKGLAYGAAKDYFDKYSEKPGYVTKSRTMGNNLQDIINKMRTYYNKKSQDRNYEISTAFTDFEYGND